MTRGRVKREPVEDIQPAPTSPTFDNDQGSRGHPVRIDTPTTEQPLASSGHMTVADEDVDMDGTHGVTTNNTSTNGVTPNGVAVNGINGTHILGGGHTDDSNVANGHIGSELDGGRSNTLTNGEPERQAPLDAMQTLGNHSRELIKVIQKLETLCIDATLPSLPKFVVVGDQSQGKSSIIEAICDIKLPRGPGTCTRCPYQITTSSTKSCSSPWSCQVSLHRKYEYNQGSKAGRDPFRFDRWDEKPLDQFHFATIYDKNQLDEVLRRAQLALLNPDQEPGVYLSPKFPVQRSKVGFSPNLVDIKIEGPNLPELSFVDLPGAINVHEDENEQHLVLFIEKLVKLYLRDEKALVLLACSSDQDVENSTAFRFVEQSKAKGRCMGVLTKPDLLVRNHERYRYVRRVLNGEIFRLGNGWFVTKQLSQQELDLPSPLTHADARRQEHAFFDSDPWSTTLIDFTHRFGIPHLQNDISLKLTTHILRELPEIMARVDGRLAEVTSQLAEFPEQPKSAAHTVMDEMQNLVTLISGHVRGDGLDNQFRTEYKQLMRTLRVQLKDVQPHVVLATPGYVKQSISLDSDDDAAEGTPTPGPRTNTPASSKMRKVNGLPFRTPQDRANTETPRSRVKPENITPEGKAVFTLDQIRQAFDRGSNSGLEDQVDPKVTDNIIQICLAGWRSIVEASLNKMKDLLVAMLAGSIDGVLTTRKRTQLYTKTNAVIEDYVNDLLRSQHELVMHIVECELYKPITFNSNLRQYIEQARTKLKKDRLVERVDEHYDTLDSQGIKVPARTERKKKLDEMETVLGPDRYTREVTAMATPLAYYEIASARMLDNIAINLQYGLMGALERDLRSVLRTGLQVTDEEYCVRLLAEDPERERRRASLTAERERLMTALAELKSLPARAAI